MAATQTEEQVSLKLLVNRERNKVLFAEAGKDFVDVLSSFLTLPLGTIVRLVGKESDMPPVRVGCLNSLYESVANLDEEHLWTKTCKEMLLQPRNSSEAYCRNLKFNIDDTEPTKYLICPNLRDCSSGLVSTFKTIRCGCGNLLSQPISLKSDNVCEGFVNKKATFIITDDLIVMPNSMDTSFGLLQNSGIENISSVQEMAVNVTEKKVMDLMKCSLFSNSTLTDFFLEKKPLLEWSRFSPCDVAASGNTSIQINVKLMMRKSDGKVLFAQGEDDFADFLFSFLTFPLGGVVRMSEGHSSLGSVDGLYKSIADLNEDKYFMTWRVKNLIVDPPLAPQFKLSNQILPISGSSYASYYVCNFNSSQGIVGNNNNHCFLTSGSGGYGSGIDTRIGLNLVDPRSPTGGYAKGPAMYTATDDLVVEPVSPISGSRHIESIFDLNIGSNKWSQPLVNRS